MLTNAKIEQIEKQFNVVSIESGFTNVVYFANKAKGDIYVANVNTGQMICVNEGNIDELVTELKGIKEVWL